MDVNRAPEPERTIWILSAGRLGDLKQMLALAAALDWPTTVKRLSFRLSKLASIPVLARQLFDAAASDPLTAPWPDLVLCAEGRASAIAHALQQRSGGTVKTVCLGRPAGSPARFDLVLTTPQYRLAAAPNVVELALPLPGETRVPTGEAAQFECRRPLIAVLVGGTSLPERLDRRAGSELASKLVDHARQVNGTVVFITSPRTDADAAAAIAEAVAPPHKLHLWRGGGDDTLQRVIAAADHVVVTSDSVSMVVDGLAAGKPVSVYRLAQHHTMKNRLIDWLSGKAQDPGSRWSRPAAKLFDHGLIEVRPDRRRLFERLITDGRLHWFGEAPRAASPGPAPADDMATAVARIKRLFTDASACCDPPAYRKRERWPH